MHYIQRLLKRQLCVRTRSKLKFKWLDELLQCCDPDLWNGHLSAQREWLESVECHLIIKTFPRQAWTCMLVDKDSYLWDTGECVNETIRQPAEWQHKPKEPNIVKVKSNEQEWCNFKQNLAKKKKKACICVLKQPISSTFRNVLHKLSVQTSKKVCNQYTVALLFWIVYLTEKQRTSLLRVY